MGRIIRNTISYGFVTLILAALGFCIYLFLDDLDGPEVTMTPDTGRISPTQEITLKLADAKSGVRSVVVTIHRNNQSLVILDKVFSEPAPVQTTSFNLKNAGLRDGAFELEITARDNSLMSFGKGNGTTRKWNMQLDTQPPKVRIKTTVPALRRGSVTAIAYSVSEDASMTGVQLGEQFFPAFLQPNGLYYCFFPFPLDTPKGKFTPELLTRDLAGNESRNRVLVNAGERNFRKDTLNISDNFLNSKEDVFKELVPDDISNLERYVRINNEVRISNEKTLLEIGKIPRPPCCGAALSSACRGRPPKRLLAISARICTMGRKSTSRRIWGRISLPWPTRRFPQRMTARSFLRSPSVFSATSSSSTTGLACSPSTPI